MYATCNQVFELRLKPNMKELDPRLFDEAERKEFDASDAKEWSSWVEHQTVRLAPEEDEDKVPKDSVIEAPMRVLRVNKSKLPGQLIAKSRTIIPGHKDPQLGLYRTYTPTTSLIALYCSVLVAVSLEWEGSTFDVTTAFLKGEEMKRKIHARAPKTG